MVGIWIFIISIGIAGVLTYLFVPNNPASKGQ